MINGNKVNQEELLKEMNISQENMTDEKEILDNFLKSSSKIINSTKGKELDEKFKKIIPGNKKAHITTTDLENIVHMKKAEVINLVNPEEIYTTDYLNLPDREIISTNIISKGYYYINKILQNKDVVNKIIKNDISNFIKNNDINIYEKYFEAKISEINTYKKTLLNQDEKITVALKKYRGKRTKIDEELRICEDIFNHYKISKEESIEEIRNLKKQKDLTSEYITSPEDLLRIETSLNKIQEDQERRETNYKILSNKFKLNYELRKKIQNRLNSIKHEQYIFKNQIANHESYAMILEIALDEYKINEETEELFTNENNIKLNYENIENITAKVTEQTNATDNYLLHANNELEEIKIPTTNYSPGGIKSDIAKYESKVATKINEIKLDSKNRLNEMFNNIIGDSIEYKD